MPVPYTRHYNLRLLYLLPHFWSHFFFSRRFFQKIMSLCYMISVQEQFLTETWPVHLSSISILIIILSNLIFKYWYFLFQKCTEILILQYYFYHQYQYFSILFNDLAIMFDTSKIVLIHFSGLPRQISDRQGPIFWRAVSYESVSYTKGV